MSLALTGMVDLCLLRDLTCVDSRSMFGPASLVSRTMGKPKAGVGRNPYLRARVSRGVQTSRYQGEGKEPQGASDDRVIN